MPKTQGQKNGGLYAAAAGRIPGIYSSWMDFINTRSKKKLDNESLMKSEEGYDVVYSNGVCQGNGQVGSVAGIGVWWGHRDYRNITERCPGAQTSSRAKLIAIARILEETPLSGRPLMIKTASAYSVKCLRDWHQKWAHNGWKKTAGKPVLNVSITRYLLALIAYRHVRGSEVELVYVKGHAGIEGNEGAGAMAVNGARLRVVKERDWERERLRVERLIRHFENRVKVGGANGAEVEVRLVAATGAVAHEVNLENVVIEMSNKIFDSSLNPLRDILTGLRHLDLSGKVAFDNSTIKAHGGYCDVFTGEYIINSSPAKVAVKRLRIHAQGSHDFAKLLAKEMNIWSKLSHPNILHLQGYVLEGDYPSLVSPWMENGTLLYYLTINPGCDSERLILGTARGLEYLHELDIIHSDIKANNILVSPDGQPLICDFGISRLLSHTHALLGGTSTGLKGSIRWMSPELLNVNINDTIPGHTKECDVWAFGMLVYEILTRKLPFYQLKLDAQVMFAIIGGQLPSFDHFDRLPPRLQAIRSLCCDELTCWNKYPNQRPTMKIVLSDLERSL